MTIDEILDEVISCSAEIGRLQNRISELRQALGASRVAAKRLSKHAQTAIAEATVKPYRVITEAGRRSISETQKKRWAAYNAAKKKAEKQAQAAPVAKKKPVAKKTARGRNIKSYWDRMTPEQRRAEMARRVAMRGKRAA